MFQQLLSYLENLDPGILKNWLVTVVGFIGSMVELLLGNQQDCFYWLLGFVVADYLSGTAAAAITGKWSSRVGGKGFIRKFIILLVALGFHGIGEIVGEPWIGVWAIGALSLNELISILENIDKAGFGSLIPARIREMLEVVQTNQENKLKSRCRKGVTDEPTL